jgi:CheY-like chemotaxis protein
MEAKKKDSAIVGEITSGALHSLNNLLQGIVGLAELLSNNTKLPEDVKLDAKMILEIADDASEIINKMRESSKATLSAKPAEKVPATSPKATTGLQRKNVKILVAEDDPMVLNVVTGMLKALGYVPIGTKDGAEAFEKYKEIKDQIDLVLADMVMPRLGGLELAEQLLNLNPNVKIVVMTGYIKEELDINPNEFGLSGWLEKPMTATRLEQVIKPIVGV